MILIVSYSVLLHTLLVGSWVGVEINYIWFYSHNFKSRGGRGGGYNLSYIVAYSLWCLRNGVEDSVNIYFYVAFTLKGIINV